MAATRLPVSARVSRFSVLKPLWLDVSVLMVPFDVKAGFAGWRLWLRKRACADASP